MLLRCLKQILVLGNACVQDHCHDANGDALRADLGLSRISHAAGLLLLVEIRKESSKGILGLWFSQTWFVCRPLSSSLSPDLDEVCRGTCVWIMYDSSAAMSDVVPPVYESSYGSQMSGSERTHSSWPSGSQALQYRPNGFLSL